MSRDDLEVELARIEHDMTEGGLWEPDQPSRSATRAARRAALADFSPHERVAIRYMLDGGESAR